MELLNAVGLLMALALIFLACREISCWYLKINEHIKLLSDIKGELRRINLQPYSEVTRDQSTGEGKGDT